MMAESPIETDEQGVRWRACQKCTLRKKLTSEFYRHVGSSTGYHSQCKDCHRAASRARYWDDGGNAERIRNRVQDRHHYDVARLVRNVEQGGDVFPPACECGCGDPVRYSQTGLNRFVNRQHMYWWNDYKKHAATARAARDAESIPIAQFRAAVNKLRVEKGWSVREVAERGGQQRGWLTYLLYGKNVQTIGRVVATDFFRRLAGLGAPPSRYQLRDVVPKPPKAPKRPTKALMSTH